MAQEIPTIIRYCTEAGGSYRIFRRIGLKALVRRAWIDTEGDLIKTLSQFDESPLLLFKDGRKIRAGLVDEVFIKRYNYRGIWTSFRRLFKLPRPMRVLAGSVRLQEHKILTPTVLATVRMSRWGLPRHDYLVTDRIQSDQIFCNKLFSEFVQPENYHSFVSGSVALLVDMHNAGVAHGDLNLRNIFCCKEKDGYSGWGVIDLDGCMIYSSGVPEFQRRRELARLVSSFLRSAQEHESGRTLQKSQVLVDFTHEYLERSGYDLSGKALDERTTYLLNRVRPDQK